VGKNGTIALNWFWSAWWRAPSPYQYHYSDYWSLQVFQPDSVVGVERNVASFSYNYYSGLQAINQVDTNYTELKTVDASGSVFRVTLFQGLFIVTKLALRHAVHGAPCTA